MTIQPYLGYDSPVNFNGELVPPTRLPDPVCPSCCDCCDCNIGVSEAGIRYSDGEIRLRLDLLSTRGFGVPWGHTLTYSSRLPDRIDFGNGLRWFVEQWPRVVDVNNEEGETQYYVAVWSPWRAVWFDVVESSFATRYGADYAFSHDETNDVFKVTTCEGEVWEFSDFDQTSLPGGLFRRMTSKGGTTIEVTSYTDLGRIGEVRRSYTSGGDTTTESFLYSYYTTCEHRGRLQTVTVRRQVNSGSWSEVARAEFEYYGEDDGVECPGDLKSASAQVLDGSTWKSTGTDFFRYYQCGETNGFCHALKYMFSPASYDRLKAAYSNPVTASDAQVAPYADRYFEFDTQQRVTTTKLDGGSRTFTYSYSTSSHRESASNWKTKTVETRPGGSQRLVYTNFLGQTLVDDFKSGSDHWIEAYKYNSNYHQTEQASPSAVSGYRDSYANLNVSLNSSTGLIRVTDYYSTTGGGAAAGHVQFEKIKKGSGGTAIKLKAFEYTSRSAGSVTIYPMSKETIYRNDDGTGGIDTEFRYTWHTGTVQMEQRTTTLPAVGSSQHGSGTSPTRVERFDLYGNLIWSKDELGVIARRSYDIPTGALVQSIADVDTTQVSDEPTGWSTPSGGGLHLVTDFQFSPLGETTESLGPSHAVDLGGTATTVRTATWTVRKPVDHEVWTAVGYATGSGPSYTYTLVNPVSITRTDANGWTIAEIQAVRASTSGKLSATDSFGQSSWVRWSAQSYTDAGNLEWARVYHTIPSSGNGSSGTNYSQTDFGFDAQGRRNKVKSPGGTITRTVFDVRGQAIKTYVGTNDTGATDSDPTCGGATGNNLVLVSENEFDGGSAGGNGLVTATTEHVDGGTTRVTTQS